MLLVEADPRRRVGLRNGATGPRGMLARGGDRAAQHIGDLGERDRERVVQHEGDALLGREPLQHHESGHPDSLVADHVVQRVGRSADPG